MAPELAPLRPSQVVERTPQAIHHASQQGGTNGQGLNAAALHIALLGQHGRVDRTDHGTGRQALHRVKCHQVRDVAVKADALGIHPLVLRGVVDAGV